MAHPGRTAFGRQALFDAEITGPSGQGRYHIRVRWLIRMTLIALVILTAADTGWSQPGSDEDARRRAGAHVERGDQFKEAGNYQGAAEEYLAAYELVPHPVLFFNLGQVYRLGGELEVALDYYERYLDAEPDGRAADQSRTYVKALRAELDRRSAQSQGGSSDAGKGDGKGAGQGTNAGDGKGTGNGEGGGSATGGSSGSAGTVMKDSGDRLSKGKTLRIAGMASAGVGVALVAVGIKFGLDASSISDELSEHDGTWTEELLAKQEQGRSAQTRMWLFSGLGVAAVAAGGALYYLGLRADADHPEGRLTATPVLSGDAAGFAISGRF